MAKGKPRGRRCCPLGASSSLEAPRRSSPAPPMGTSPGRPPRNVDVTAPRSGRRRSSATQNPPLRFLRVRAAAFSGDAPFWGGRVGVMTSSSERRAEKTSTIEFFPKYQSVSLGDGDMMMSLSEGMSPPDDVEAGVRLNDFLKKKGSSEKEKAYRTDYRRKSISRELIPLGGSPIEKELALVVCRKASVADLVFLVDGSWSITQQNFKIIQEFLYTLVNSFDIGEDKVQIGLIQYSDQPRNEFFLNTYQRKEDILHKIQNLHYKGGGTKTGESLQFMLDTQFNEMAGSRRNEGVPQIAVVITDGQAQDNIREPAEAVKNAGITLYAVGIKDAVLSELQEIASDPDELHVYSVVDFAALQGISQKIIQVLCTTAEEVSGQINQVSQVCTKATVADIVFLVDSSTSIGEDNFEEVKNFLSVLVSNLDVGRDQVRIGLAQYSRKTFKEFLLNQYALKSDILELIRNLTFRRGSTYTGAALDFVRAEYFTKSAGSRAQENIPQVLILITDGESKDDVKVPARKLNARGISVYVVGIGIQDTTQVEEIASRPSHKFLFKIDSYGILQELARNFLQTVCFEVGSQMKVCSSASVADIAFLVDESSRVGEKNFQLTRAFLLRIINALDIGPNNVQVALVLYSDVPRLEFTLDTFEDKLKVLNYVKRLRFRGGRPYTGAAIDFLRKEVFTKKAGSRRDQGVQQLAVVITDGYSLDTFIEPASRLRRSDITMYAVGIQNIPESSLLQQIVTHPPRKHVTNMELFLKQPDIEWKIKERLCNGIVERAFVTPVRYRTLKEGCEQTEEADIYFLIDGSGSIFPKDFDDMKAFMNEMVDAFQVGANRVRFGVVQYQGYAKLEFEIGQYKTKTDLRKAIDAIKQMGHGTYTGRALEVMKSLFKKAARENVPKYLVLITDGISDDDVTRPALELQKEGIMIYAIGVRNASKTQLEQITGEKNQTFLVNEFDSLKRIKHDVVREICSPKACKNLKVDIIFLIDTSESMNATQFNLTKDFMQAIINQSDIGADKVQIGLLKYSTAAELEFRLNTYRTKDALRDAISKVTQIEEGTKTGNALQHASRYFDASEGGRPEVKQHLIVVTDGESKDKVEEPATKLREKGIIIHAVGIVKAVYSELRQIAGMADRVYMEDSYESLTHLEKTILFYVCNPDAGCRKPEVADVIYVVHGSTNTHFQGMRQLMAAVVNDSVVGKGYVQFGAVAYSNRPVEKFSLNKFSTKEEVGKAVYSMSSLNGQAFTAKALNFARERFDAAYSGQTSPPDTARFVVLITDAPTADRPDLPAAVEALEKKGIKLIAIGTEAADAEELKDMVGDEGWSFFAPSYGTLESYRQNITHILCDKSKPACGTQQADLVFLVDGAKSITPSNFTVMKTFMKNIVNSFLIAENKIHIGVVQYSDAPQTEFYLNEFYSDTEIKRKIENMAQLESATFTGRALRFVKSVFQPANGGRKDQGVLQSLVVVTDGKSDDDVNEAAIALRNYGINIFSVGIGKNLSESFELNQIAGRPDRVFRVINFNELETIEKSIFKEICDVADQPRDCDIDISVAVDSSRHASTMRLKQLMQTQLLRLVPAMASMINISCPVEPPMNIRFRYQVFAGNGRSLFDSNFEVYDEEIIQKFLEVQTTMNTYLNTNFLEAFWDSSFSLASTRVKVLVVFTDGPDDSIQNLKATADSLRKQGLDALLMIGLENVENYNELQQTEFGRGFGYREPLQIGNPLLPSTLWRQIDSIAERKCCKACCKCFGDDGQGGHRGPPGIKLLQFEKEGSAFKDHLATLVMKEELGNVVHQVSKGNEEKQVALGNGVRREQEDIEELKVKMDMTVLMGYLERRYRLNGNAVLMVNGSNRDILELTMMTLVLQVKVEGQGGGESQELMADEEEQDSKVQMVYQEKMGDQVILVNLDCKANRVPQAAKAYRDFQEHKVYWAPKVTQESWEKVALKGTQDTGDQSNRYCGLHLRFEAVQPSENLAIQPIPEGLDGKDDYGAPGKKGAKGEDGDLGVPGDKGIKGIRGRVMMINIPGYL
uniref:collagen alpha-6(VI) chain-like n=1 Tax=Euleptes europaea TaxID=460621 RepID=UPI0025411CE6|nr:collagen alpha-6(VI) chain-like [Euleptes europaea]